MLFVNLKLEKQTCHGGVLLLVKSKTPPWMFFKFFKLNKWQQIAQSVSQKFQKVGRMDHITFPTLLFVQKYKDLTTSTSIT